LAGLAEFVRSLRATWRSFLLRFVGGFVLSVLLWAAVAPVYASLLATLARPLIPRIERARATHYLVQGSTIVAVRPILLPQQRGLVERREPLWVPDQNYGLVLLAALVLATPGWSLRQRGRILGVSFALITLTQLALVVVRAEHTQLAPFETPYGRFSLIPPGYSPAMRALFKWLYGFFAVVGPGFFALLLYCGALAFTWRARGKRIRGRSLRGNVECPCGSGLKAKRCCRT
jgi:hypothetical protein